MKLLWLSFDAFFVINFVTATASKMLVTLSLIIAKNASITRTS
jgi:hypothetical protein